MIKIECMSHDKIVLSTSDDYKMTGVVLHAQALHRSVFIRMNKKMVEELITALVDMKTHLA